MKDFSKFNVPAFKNQVVAQVLIKRGKFRLHGPNDQVEERKVREQVDVAFEALKRYHEWLNS